MARPTMTDCSGLCSLFIRKHSDTMGSGISRSIRNKIMGRDRRSNSVEPPLEIIWVDYQLRDNGMKHRTDKYACMREADFSLVVRRGQPFDIILKFNQDFDKKADKISIIFAVDCSKCPVKTKPDAGNGSYALVPVMTTPRNDLTWSAYILNVYDDEVVVRITTPVDCLVAKWLVEIDVQRGDEVSINFGHRNPLYVLFNPWCPADEVYMENEKGLDEYVLNDSGLMWRGTYSQQKEVAWKYGQFDQNILEASFMLLVEIGQLEIPCFKDPVLVSRVFSQAVNAPDDKGAIQGNWTNDFSGGTAPTEWLGSTMLLRKFLRERKPVKYGQCWVFAGVMTTVCRAIGLPCRPVTAYCAAHDTNSSLTVDCTVDDNGRIMEEMNSDSIWNYHVWNEVWMARPDLKEPTPGWQVIDATPQELSANIFRCGPASVAAVKAGDTRVPYDTAFVYAEVNADKVYWMYNGVVQPYKMLKWDGNAVGKKICTKMIDRWEQEDVTANYKHPDNSQEERSVMLRALKMNQSAFTRYYLNENFNDIKFEFDLIDDILIGENFRVGVTMTNKGMMDYTVKTLLRCESVDYTGKNGIPIISVEDVKVVRHDKGNNKTQVVAVLTYEDYGKAVKAQNAFNVSFLGNVVGTDYDYYAQDDFRVKKPDISFTLPDKVVYGTSYLVSASFRNSMPVPLKKGVFYIEGASIEKRLKIKLRSNVEAKSTAICSFNFTPMIMGRNVLAAKFTSRELQDVDGFKVIMVVKPSLVNDIN